MNSLSQSNVGTILHENLNLFLKSPQIFYCFEHSIKEKCLCTSFGRPENKTLKVTKENKDAKAPGELCITRHVFNTIHMQMI